MSNKECQIAMISKKISNLEKNYRESSAKLLKYLEENPDFLSGLEVVKNYMISYHKHKRLCSEIMAPLSAAEYNGVKTFRDHLNKTEKASTQPNFNQNIVDSLEKSSNNPEFKRILRGYYYHHVMSQTNLQHAMKALDELTNTGKPQQVYKLIMDANNNSKHINKQIKKYNKLARELYYSQNIIIAKKPEIKEFYLTDENNNMIYKMLTDLESYTSTLEIYSTPDNEFELGQLRMSKNQFARLVELAMSKTM